ncbi:hypothetical protein JCM9492_13610 [Aquifex pyrophilus]
MRTRYLTQYSFWDAYALDLAREIEKKATKSTLRKVVRRLTKEYLIALAYFVSGSWKKAEEILRKKTSFRVSKEDLEKVRFKKIQGITPSFEKPSRGKGIRLKKVLKDFCPWEVSEVRISKKVATLLKKAIRKVLKRRRKIKVLDKMAMYYLWRAWYYARAYSYRVNLKRASRFIQRALKRIGIELPLEVILFEVRKRLYRKFKREFYISS